MDVQGLGEIACSALVTVPTKAEVRKMYEDCGNWRTVCDALGVSVGVAWRYANTDYEPKDPILRRLLKLPLVEVIIQEVQRDEKGRFT